MTNAIRFTLKVRDSWKHYTARMDREVTAVACSVKDAIQAYKQQTKHSNIEFLRLTDATVAISDDLSLEKESEDYFICPSLKEGMDIPEVKDKELRVQAWKMKPIPAGDNPFHHDLYNMGTTIVRGWIAMHPGYDSDTPEEGAQYPIEYIILVNTRTGNRVKIKIAKDF